MIGAGLRETERSLQWGKISKLLCTTATERKGENANQHVIDVVTHKLAIIGCIRHGGAIFADRSE